MSVLESSPGRVVYSDTVDAQVSVLKGVNNQKVLTYPVKLGMKAYLAFLGDAWDAGLDTFLTRRVTQDGGGIYQLQDSKVQTADPAEKNNELSPWIPLIEGATLRYEVDVSSAAGVASGNVTARFVVKYVAK